MSKENKKPENPTAFPHSYHIDCGETGFETKVFKGMTLRDYFAAKAVSGQLSSDYAGELITEGNAERFAEDAYRIADAMLKEREK